MSMQILDGKALSIKLKENLKLQIDTLKKQIHKTPLLVNVIVGQDPGALSYATSQKKAAEALGVDYRLEVLDEGSLPNDLQKTLTSLNANSDVHGIILSKPLPSNFDHADFANQIVPAKDVEGLNTLNLGRLFLGQTTIIPCTAAAAIEHLRSTGVNLKGKDVVVLGRSEIVGKPLVFLLLQENATVTVCHSGTSQAGKLKEHLSRADVVIASVGKPKFVSADMIKPGAIVIDVGINEVNGKIVGDVDFEGVSSKTSFITPVPGGVGPVTSVLLIRNLIELFKEQNKI